MKRRDIQVKFKVQDINEFLNKLRDDNFILIGGAFENIVRYDFEDNRLQKQGIFVRTKEGFDKTITVKEKIDNSINKYFERNTLSFEIEDCDSMKYVLQKIGLTNMFKMEKYRIIWKKGHLEIHLDELPFGVYCDIRASVKDIDKFIKEYNVRNIYNCTYWDIYYELDSDNKGKDVLFKDNHVFKITSLI